MSELEKVDCVVIGAGVVGLAVARELALAGREVIVLESTELIGSETSSRNSEVIHAGIYYPKDSLKALFCVEGKKRLYQYCADHGVPHERCGKLIVATLPEQVDTLKEIQAKAAANGVGDLEMMSGNEATLLEPELNCVAALRSPSTGIIDSHGLMLAYQGDAEEHGAMIAFLCPVLGGEVSDEGIILEVGGDMPMRLLCNTVVNSAGLYAPEIAGKIANFPEEQTPTAYYAKGNYYSLLGKPPFSRLIYPVPEPGGLGVHITIDLGGQARFGPDVEWIDEVEYTVDPARSDKFYDAVRTYWPGLKDGALDPGYAGIRPKISAPGEEAADFVVQGPADHGVPGLVNLFGIESPGLTASLAIAERVREVL
ncbi:MAG: NAD(P)/FAD-dependent oxidoreductase [Pseudomonadota bacterium]|nr:NAD(P)/FAD-dependent oxidoreductase [Pseudomonadota bacterium]